MRKQITFHERLRKFIISLTYLYGVHANLLLQLETFPFCYYVSHAASFSLYGCILHYLKCEGWRENKLITARARAFQIFMQITSPQRSGSRLQSMHLYVVIRWQIMEMENWPWEAKFHDVISSRNFYRRRPPFFHFLTFPFFFFLHCHYIYFLMETKI